MISSEPESLALFQPPPFCVVQNPLAAGLTSALQIFVKPRSIQAISWWNFPQDSVGLEHWRASDIPTSSRQTWASLRFYSCTQTLQLPLQLQCSIWNKSKKPVGYQRKWQTNGMSSKGAIGTGLFGHEISFSFSQPWKWAANSLLPFTTEGPEIDI